MILLSLRGEIAAVQVRINQLQEQLSTKASQDIFGEIAGLWRLYLDAAQVGDEQQVPFLREAIDKKLRQGAAIGAKWNDLITASKDKAALAAIANDIAEFLGPRPDEKPDAGIADKGARYSAREA